MNRRLRIMLAGLLTGPFLSAEIAVGFESATQTPPPAVRNAKGAKMLVVQLHSIEATTAAAAVDELLASRKARDSRVSVQTDPRTNAIMVSGTNADLRRARELLMSLDQDGNGSAPFAPLPPIGQ